MIGTTLNSPARTVGLASVTCFEIDSQRQATSSLPKLPLSI